ncbi:hypothetical protein ACA29_11495 [Lederbergia galactosidilytica]|uniref:Uncharacterized protein n=1 Tax=Lederbergia galactosidilytica TaxID=217031 RepID=A0A0Q9Y490_9BACI|nr:hypothetical protein ACA29_11495 [Lederbergia galactosidilytica]
MIPLRNPATISCHYLAGHFPLYRFDHQSNRLWTISITKDIAASENMSSPKPFLLEPLILKRSEKGGKKAGVI